MKTSITAGLDKKDALEINSEFLSVNRLRGRLVDMMKKDIEVIHKSMSDLDNFEVPNWALLQASKIAEVKAKQKLILLLSN